MLRGWPLMITRTPGSLGATMEALRGSLAATAMTEEQWTVAVTKAPSVLTRSPDNVRQQVEGLREVLRAGEGAEGDVAVAKAIRRKPHVLAFSTEAVRAKRRALEDIVGGLLGEVRGAAGVSGGRGETAGAREGAGRKQRSGGRAHWAKAGASVEGVATKMIGTAPGLLEAGEERVVGRVGELMDLMAGRVGRACVAGAIMSYPTLIAGYDIETVGLKWRVLVRACERNERWGGWLDSGQAGSLGTILKMGLESVAVLLVIVDLAEEWEAGAVPEVSEEEAAVREAAARLMRRAPGDLVNKSKLGAPEEEGQKKKRPQKGSGRKSVLDVEGVDVEAFWRVVEPRAEEYAEAAQ
ncbi:unnamed protein product [Pedinophyceae sp. YPF-701]|nr:unnamed protein product [Pedinophyceae sp. YPF-701]